MRSTRPAQQRRPIRMATRGAAKGVAVADACVRLTSPTRGRPRLRGAPDRLRRRNGPPPPLRLAVFDLDGTLTVPGTSVLRHLGRVCGFEAVAHDLVTRYAAGGLRNADVSARAAAALAGRRLTDLRGSLATLPMVDGIAETVRCLERHGVYCAISTITFDFAAQYVAERFGFHRTSATRLGFAGGTATGEVLDVLEDQDKCVFIADLCAELQTSKDHTVFVGDARSDIPAMRMTGHSVAFNAIPDVRALASVVVDGSTDLRDVLPPVRHLLAAG